MSVLLRKQKKQLLAASVSLLSFAGLDCAAWAQFGQTQTNSDLQLAADSPFRDPDIIYLEADTLTNDEAGQILTAAGAVEGRYEDKTLRADKVVYYLDTGKVIAVGNVVLVQGDGSSQYADKLELSNELNAGTATEFVARLPGGGVTAASFVARGENGEVELYNAYYTACKVCEEDPNPSWRIKARQVTQDADSRTVQYRDATLELFGIPVLYTPYLAHPDPSAERASGFLTPFGGVSGSTGVNVRVPYYWAIDDSTEVTITPRIFSKVNPVLSLKAARQFHTGRIEAEGSLTYGSIFDNDGNAFDDPSVFLDPDNAPVGRKLRGNLNAKGLFRPTNFWTYGFGLQYTSDDTYLDRYNLSQRRDSQGLYQSLFRTDTSQAFIIGQDESTRVSVSSVAFQDRNDLIIDLDNGLFRFIEFDDGILPLVLPRIEGEHNITDPLLSGRLKASGNLTVLTRENGSDYARATASLDYGKTWIAPGGVELKPFANVRGDFYKIELDDDNLSDVEDNQFIRTLGQAGVDIRYPFIKAGNKVSWVLEPRAQVTQSFGDAKLDDFVERGASDIFLSEDGGNADLSASLLWQSNKAAGFDFWQEGTRLDVGGSLVADWGQANSASLFVGQSFASNGSGDAIDGLSSSDGDFLPGSGLSGGRSDIVGEGSLTLGGLLTTRTRLRYNQNLNDFSRIDSSASLRTKWVEAQARYFRLSSASSVLVGTPNAPSEEISGSIRLNWNENWSSSYWAFRDIDRGITRSQRVGLRYRDDCALFEILYSKNQFGNNAILDNSSIGFRVSLLTLGDVGG